MVSLQLEICRGLKGVQPQEIVSTQAPSPTLRYCEGGMEEMDEMEYLVLVDLKDREERLGYKDRRESKE